MVETGRCGQQKRVSGFPETLLPSKIAGARFELATFGL